jgi:ADP-heptose:LPS heptosyltransferase
MTPVVTAVRLGRLGDLVMTWPALRWLAQDVTLQVVTGPTYGDLVRHAVPEARVVAPDGASELAPANALLDLHGVAASRRLLGRLPVAAGCALTRTPKQSLQRRALLIPGLRGGSGGQSWPSRHLRAAAELRRRLGLAGLAPDPLPRLAAPSASQPPGITGPDPGPVIGLVLGAGHPTKAWPSDSFARLAAAWTLRGGRVRLFAGPGEGSLAESVSASCPTAERWEDGAAPLLGLCDGLAGCDVVVGGDTGPVHLAGALGIPVVGLFGPTPLRAGFWVWERGVALRPVAACAPCSMHGAAPCPRARRVCLEGLAPERVLDAAGRHARRRAA